MTEQEGRLSPSLASERQTELAVLTGGVLLAVEDILREHRADTPVTSYATS